MFEVLENRKVSKNMYKMKIRAPLIAGRAKAGQFVIILIDEKGERVPFTLCGWDEETIDFAYAPVGNTTNKLSQIRPGEGIQHVVGPLGRPSEIDHFGNVVTVASGYGIAGIIPTLKELKKKENRIFTIAQVPGQEDMFEKERLEKLNDKLFITRNAFILLRALIEEKKGIDRIIMMSSLCLMRSICEMTKRYSIKTMVHLTPLMVDGTGMCGACRVRIAGENRFTCVHGPEFDGHEVEGWELLISKRCGYGDKNFVQQSFQCSHCSQW